MGTHSWRDPHMVQGIKSLLHALFVTAGVFLVAAVVVHLAGAVYVSWLESETITAFEAGVAQDLEYLKTHGDALAQNDTLLQDLVAKDVEPLLEFIQSEGSKYSIPSIGVADSNGIIVSRTNKKLGIQGDNVFLTVPEGRVVAQGKSIQNVGQAAVTPNQVRMTAGTPILQKGQMVGGLFMSFTMNDEYTRRFADTHLPPGVGLVFYTREFGVYSDSFSNPDTRVLVDSYFNTGSAWVQSGDSDKTISFNNGSFYLIKNYIFPGLDGSSPVGALLFMPRHDISNVGTAIIALFTLLTFLWLAFRSYFRTRGIERGWRYYVLLAVAALPVVLITYLLLTLQNRSFLHLEQVQYPLYNSTLRFQPDSGIYSAGFDQQLSIIADTGDEPINAVQIALTFDPAAVKIKEIQPVASTCSYVIENSIDQAHGTASLSCVILDLNQGRQSLAIADIVVSPQRTGTFSLSFDNAQTKVLAKDGLATNVLRMSQGSSYKVDNFDPILQGATATSSVGRTFVVFSPTHPNQSRWYNAPTAHFVWRGLPSVVYRYAFDSFPDTIPTNGHTTQNSQVDIAIPGDGIYYFHLQLVSGGPVGHYRVQADMTPPTILSIEPSAERIVAGDVVRFSFEAQDVASGIQQNYYIDLGNHLFLPVGSQLFVPLIEAGNQRLVLRVYDNAGNFTEKSQTIHVEAR